MYQKYYLSVFLRDRDSWSNAKVKVSSKFTYAIFTLGNRKDRMVFPPGSKQQQMTFAFYRSVFFLFFNCQGRNTLSSHKWRAPAVENISFDLKRSIKVSVTSVNRRLKEQM